MHNRATEFWVGLFTLFGIGLALYMVYRTGDLRWKREPGYEVYANFQNISGLDVGDTVRVAGVDVGKVGEIKLKGALGALAEGGDVGYGVWRCVDLVHRPLPGLAHVGHLGLDLGDGLLGFVSL